MKEKEQGFTLLEMMVCFIIFGIFLECLWGFYTHIHINHVTFNQQVKLTSEGDNIEAFIRESIRDAKKVKITTSGSGGVGEEEIESGHMNDVQQLELIKIEFTRVVDEGGTPTEKSCMLEITNNGASDIGKGAHNLVYKVDSSEKIISDQIENIKVTSKKDSNLVTFECVLCKKDETNSRLKVTKQFSESLAYKEHMS